MFCVEIDYHGKNGSCPIRFLPTKINQFGSTDHSDVEINGVNTSSCNALMSHPFTAADHKNELNIHRLQRYNRKNKGWLIVVYYGRYLVDSTDDTLDDG